MSTALVPFCPDLLPSDLAELPARVRQEFSFWRSQLEPLLSLDRGVQRAIEAVAERTHQSEGTVRKKFYAVKKSGWSALIDRRYVGPEVWNRKGSVSSNLSAADKELVKTYCERYQRSSAAAIKALRRDWVKGLVTTSTAVDARTGSPRMELPESRPLRANEVRAQERPHRTQHRCKRAAAGLHDPCQPLGRIPLPLR